MDEHEAFELFHSAFDVEPRPGAFDRLRTVVARSSVKPQRRIEIGLPLVRLNFALGDPPALRFISGLVAVLLAVAVVGGLLYSRGAFNRVSPVTTPPLVRQNCPDTPSASPSSAGKSASTFPAQDLQVTAFDNPDLLTTFHVHATLGAQGITLIGAYADPVLTILILRPDASDTRVWLPVLLHDDQGEKISVIGSDGLLTSGDYVFTLQGPKGFGPDRIAHLDLTLGLQSAVPVPQPSGPPEYVLDNVAGSVLIDFSLAVQPEILLPLPSPFRLGGGKVTIQALELTPARLHLQAKRDGVEGDGYDPDALGREVMYSVCPPCPSVIRTPPTPAPKQSDCIVRWLGESGVLLSGRTYGMVLDWPSLAPGTYRLVLSTALGDTHAVTLSVPPSSGRQ